MSVRTLGKLGFAVFGILLISWGCGGDQNIQSLIDLKAPRTVENVQAFPADRRARIIWTPNTEPALVGYNIYRSTTSRQGFELVGSTGITQTPFFEDQGAKKLLTEEVSEGATVGGGAGRRRDCQGVSKPRKVRTSFWI